MFDGLDLSGSREHRREIDADWPRNGRDGAELALALSKHPVEVDRKLVKLRAHSSEVEPPHDLAVAIGSPTAN